LAGVVLAGGASTRFGRDKLVEVVDGHRLVDRAVAALRDVCDGPVLVASGDGVSRAGLADGQVADLPGAAGPLAAIGAGLLALSAAAPAVAVLAGDHLAPSPGLLRLLAAARGDAACALADVGGWWQPLHAVWSTSVADAVAVDVRAGGASPLRWLGARADVVVLGRATLAAAGIDVAVTRDVDRPEDLPG
jgi:molybdopterin-guanine dinucleotide biosynthesis protein A